MAMMLFILSAPWRASSDAKGSEKPAEFMAAILACAAPMGVTPAARHSSRRSHEAWAVRRFPVAPAQPPLGPCAKHDPPRNQRQAQRWSPEPSQPGQDRPHGGMVERVTYRLLGGDGRGGQLGENLAEPATDR
jgi:hypothetical protein